MKIKILGLLIASLTVVAHAELRTFQFIGTVTQSLPMAAAGTKVIGNFSYDTATKPLYAYSLSADGSSAAGYRIPRTFTLQVNGHNLVSESIYVDIFDYVIGDVNDAISIYSTPMTLDGTYYAEGAFGIFLNSAPGKTSVLRSTDLPRNINANQFNWQSYGVVQVNGGPSGALLNFSIDRVKEIND